MIKEYGKKVKGKVPIESAEMITFFNYVRREYPNTYGKTITHVRNEGKRNIQQTQKQKAEGMITGASDIFCPGCPSFTCEMKSTSTKGAKVSAEQKIYLDAVDKTGGFACVARGYKGAIEAFEEWINAQR